MDELSISASIVVYNHSYDDLKPSLDSFFQSIENGKLYLVDNSDSDVLRNDINDARVVYIFNNANLGYGAGHNIAITESINSGFLYHIVINPDIKFDPHVLPHLYYFMNDHLDVGLMMPKVYYEDGSLQRLCKLLPTPFDLIGRRFFPNAGWAKKINERYELHSFDYENILNTPCLSGCFMFIRTSVLQKTGLFDVRYFMYLEDYDLVRRIHRTARTLFYPFVSITHGHAKLSYKSKKLLKIHLRSAIKYFNKWGWFLDRERKELNRRIFSEVQKTR